MPRNLLIVESPSKAKTLSKYLGDDFQILASYGHVRDLEAKEGAVEPAEGFHMRYALIDRNRKHVDAITRAAQDADEIYLATDPDREGEAIAWHLSEILREKKKFANRTLHRVVFYEITESAVREGVAHPREISLPLVNAQQARRALDHLVGFKLSPLLWRKIRQGTSAGRVQSPALRLIVEREQQIEAFKTEEYWTVHLDSHKGKDRFRARLHQYEGKKVEQFSFTSDEQQLAVVKALADASGAVAQVLRVEKKPKARHAAAPFITSTLQQEAVRKLGMTATQAMRTAQQLYEGVDLGGSTAGLITYMRTDSTNLAQEALAEIRSYIQKQFSAGYLPKAAVHYRSKAKNAQEAHEAIRPTSILRTPESLRGHLTQDQARLYEMIWKRTLASQMSPARFDTTSVDLSVGGEGNIFRASGQTLAFAGFIAVYLEDVDDALEEGEEKLPPLEVGEAVPVDRLYGEQHFTQPPPRYTEASLVKRLEEYGIGRPSTYASIISTLQEREYAILDKKRFLPTDLGRIVVGFLTSHFQHYVDYDFTARMEEELDLISNGEREWVPVLSEFWEGFSRTLAERQDVPRGTPMGEPCPTCARELYLQHSKRGLFVGCSGYPECDYARPWRDEAVGPMNLGKDPASGLDVLLLKGPYGFYVQLGETVEGAKSKPRRGAWPKEVSVAEASLDLALRVLSLPRNLGLHPNDGAAVEANIGRFGPYVKHGDSFRSIPKSDSPYEITLDRAVALLAAPKAARGVRGKELGPHPADEQQVVLHKGRFGPYVKHGKISATVPPDLDPEALTLEQALPLLAAKAGVAKTRVVGKARAAANDAPLRAAASRRPPAAGRRASATADAAASKPPAAKKTAATKPKAKAKAKAPAKAPAKLKAKAPARTGKAKP